MWKIKRGHWKLLEFLCVFVLQFEELIILKEGNFFFFKKKQLLWWHLGICFNGLIFVCTFFLRPFKDLGLRYWKLVISFIFVTLSVLLPNQGSTSKAIHILLWKTFGLEATSWNCRTLGCCGPFKRSMGVSEATLTAELLSPPPEEAVPSSWLASAAGSRWLPGIPADLARILGSDLPLLG